MKLFEKCSFLKITPVLAVLYLPQYAVATEDKVVDFSDQMTSVCEVSGLYSPPPPGWFNVPIDTGDARAMGCQMMRTEGNDVLVGILRLLSVKLPDTEDGPPWGMVMIEIERRNIAVMGYSIGEVLWSRETVPISGPGFMNARAVGFKALIEGDDIPQEAQFLVFEKEKEKYIVTLLTPGRKVDEGIYYKRNTDDFGVLIRSLKVPRQ